VPISRRTDHRKDLGYLIATFGRMNLTVFQKQAPKKKFLEVPLIMTALLFYAVAPTFLIILSLTIGLISGVCITLLIHNLINIIKIKKVGK